MIGYPAFQIRHKGERHEEKKKRKRKKREIGQ
jgi:hypothetical protein